MWERLKSKLMTRVWQLVPVIRTRRKHLQMHQPPLLPLRLLPHRHRQRRAGIIAGVARHCRHCSGRPVEAVTRNNSKSCAGMINGGGVGREKGVLSCTQVRPFGAESWDDGFGEALMRMSRGHCVRRTWGAPLRGGPADTANAEPEEPLNLEPSRRFQFVVGRTEESWFMETFGRRGRGHCGRRTRGTPLSMVFPARFHWWVCVCGHTADTV